MDKVDTESIKGLMKDGSDLYEENKVSIENMLKDIIDERYA